MLSRADDSRPPSPRMSFGRRPPNVAQALRAMQDDAKQTLGIRGAVFRGRVDVAQNLLNVLGLFHRAGYDLSSFYLNVSDGRFRNKPTTPAYTQFTRCNDGVWRPILFVSSGLDLFQSIHPALSSGHPMHRLVHETLHALHLDRFQHLLPRLQGTDGMHTAQKHQRLYALGATALLNQAEHELYWNTQGRYGSFEALKPLIQQHVGEYAARSPWEFVPEYGTRQLLLGEVRLPGFLHQFYDDLKGPPLRPILNPRLNPRPFATRRLTF